jgi:glycosyltransferase involved in cell wall biosynthesis
LTDKPIHLPLVQLIFRRVNPHSFSIEKVFGTLKDTLQRKILVQSSCVPFYTSSVNNIFRNISFARKIRGDVFHVTGDVHYVVLGLPGEKTILTIHDNVYIRYSKGPKRFFFKWIFLKLPVGRCRFVTTISEKSKNEIVKYTGCNPDKVVVIPNPLNEHIYFIERNFNAANPVLLFIGSTPNKNLERVIRALKGISCTLEIIGRISEEHVALLKECGISYRQFIRLSDQEVADRYAACDMVVFASLYEGFGLPILEGQKAGRPILTSNISPMKEVAGEGACLVDPEDVESIRSGINKVIADGNYRDCLIQKGFENIKQYDVRKIADQYLKLYETIMNT